MVPTANNNTPTPEPTGDLEQLFRQKLGEAEVAPRMHLWEQIDHELLVQQNETYRRRLVWHRWVAAACILLFLGAGSWFTVQRTGLTGASAPLAGRTTTAGQTQTTGSGNAAGVGLAAAGLTAESFEGQPGATASTSNEFVAAAATATEADALANNLAAATHSSARLASLNGVAPSVAEATAVSAGAGSFFTSSQVQAGRASSSSVAYGTAATGSTGSLFDLVMNAGNSSYAASATGKTSAASWLTALSSHPVSLPGLLHIGRPDTLKAALPSAPAMSLAQAAPKASEEKERETIAPRPRKWRLMGSYAASAYNPNMAFASAAGATAAAPSVSNGFSASRNTTNTYDLAAREYRQNLRPGFAQRVALTVSYVATKHWTISAGLQAAEQQATSQTSYSFLDGKLPLQSAISSADKNNSLTPPRPAQLRTAQYRYRTAGVPVSVRYGSSRNGVSLYAKVGAAVNVLFNSQSELVGVPEATTTYSLSSVGSPYRKVQGSVNGGAGVRYKPASAQWSLAVGPTAEAGLSTLNANAAQSSYQARPYAIGMEASVEFGGSRAATVLH
ncbi:hypothetical protein [Hymenobacter lucidus]|uniref:Outer membrane protein beta-barrel domain-containing protein n=1 Tax=Hymenobacter lucidus TaxID=2880930 RepID=A0ABS8ALQ0_9BACT|nr:hypothetical protein [Hymenobacter lucidus]MCB2406978.1 hypothetical protein [Hymenobacter lucidus]